MKEILLNDFTKLWLAIVCTYLVQLLIKVAGCLAEGTFDWKALLKGLGINFIYFLAIGVMFNIGFLIPELTVITINSVEYTLQDAITIIGLALECKQILEVILNFKEYFKLDKIKPEEPEIKEKKTK